MDLEKVTCDHCEYPPFMPSKMFACKHVLCAICVESTSAYFKVPFSGAAVGVSHSARVSSDARGGSPLTRRDFVRDVLWNDAAAIYIPLGIYDSHAFLWESKHALASQCAQRSCLGCPFAPAEVPRMWG